MITPRRNMERRHVKRGNHEVCLTFYAKEGPGSSTDDFGALAAFNEIRLSPGGVSVPRPRQEAEIITYVYKGALAHEDSNGSSGVAHAGEFQHMTMGRGTRHNETNASRTDWAHVFRITLHPSKVGLYSAPKQKRFAAAQRHNALCVVASPDGRHESLPILQDALIYSSILDPGHHLIHELAPGRSTWLHVIHGEATLHDVILAQGDGAGVRTEPSLSLTALENTEILLVDLGPMPRSFGHEVLP